MGSVRTSDAIMSAVGMNAENCSKYPTFLPDPSPSRKIMHRATTRYGSLPDAAWSVMTFFCADRDAAADFGAAAFGAGDDGSSSGSGSDR